MKEPVFAIRPCRARSCCSSRSWSFPYHEFLQFSEDLGADALYVINAGVWSSMRSGTYLNDDH